jgi:hypothetical protein
VQKKNQSRSEAHLPAILEAATALYFAGFWHCDRPVDEAALWEALRDACGIEPGQTAQLGGDRRKGV